MGNKTEITNVERLEIMEDKYGVTLDGIFVEYEVGYLSVRGDIQAINGATINQSLEIVMTAYNRSGKVIQTASEYFDVDTFFAISPFSFWCEVIEKPEKVRVYPKAS